MGDLGFLVLRWNENTSEDGSVIIIPSKEKWLKPSSQSIRRIFNPENNIAVLLNRLILPYTSISQLERMASDHR